MKNIIILSAVFIIAGQSYLPGASAGEYPSELQSHKFRLSIDDKLIRSQLTEIKRCSPLDNQLMQRAFELDERRIEKLLVNLLTHKQIEKVPDAHLLFTLDGIVRYIDNSSCSRPLLTSFTMLKYLRFLETNVIGKFEDKNWYWLDKREQLDLLWAAEITEEKLLFHKTGPRGLRLKDIFPEEHRMLYPDQYEEKKGVEKTQDLPRNH